MKLRDYVSPFVLSVAAIANFGYASLNYRSILDNNTPNKQTTTNNGSFGVMQGLMFSTMAILDLARKKDLENLLKND